MSERRKRPAKAIGGVANKPKPESASAKPTSAKPTSAKPASAKRARPLRPAIAKASAPAQRQTAFPIVGIGASAGGLEALEVFFRRVPQNSGMAFVVVQHLDPSHKGAMVELLQRCAHIPVSEAADGMRVESNHVYVIAPNCDLSIMHGTLHVMRPLGARGLRLPIDFFFRSLAQDQQERAIGVVLSGMGSDGALGLRAIKEKAGAAFVQSLVSAKFDGMPRSAIETGLADVVESAEALPAKIIAYARHAPHIAHDASAPEEKARSALEKIFVLLRLRTGNDFSSYKKSTIYRRIERRMGLHQIDSIATYVSYLRENPEEIEQLFKELLIGVTSFFRDPESWDYLGREALPTLLAERGAGTALRAWVPGCSTGEEAYSLAIVFKETLERLKPATNVTLQVFATDLDKDAIEQARTGAYPANIVADVSAARLRRFFVQDERGYRVGKDIREMVIFAPQNLIMDPPFTKLDILSCRNVLIYLAPEVQKKLVPLFGYALNPSGILFLGTAETVGTFTDLFAPLDGRTRIYRRLPAAVGAQVEFPTVTAQGARAESSQEAGEDMPAPINLQMLAERVLVQRFSPAAALTNDKGDVLYFSGRTGKYLEPPAGRATLNILSMAREGLRAPLATGFRQALHDGRAVKLSRIKVKTNGGRQAVDVSIERIVQPPPLRGTVMVVFTDIDKEHADRPAKEKPHSARELRYAEVYQQLQDSAEEAQSIREEMQTSQEELKSTNEELQSTNEELQSTNEELTTSKEEMQSLNEELQTVNHELQAKVDELSRANNDMKNLLNSTDIATLFLDGQLNVRRFTTQTTRIIKLIPGDAGRPITDITTQLDYPDIVDDANEVLRTLVFRERVAPARDGHWYCVRILPYRTLENVIDGVVITFTDVTSAKQLEATLRDQAYQLRQMAEALPNLVWAARPDGTWDYLSRQWVEYTGVSEAEQLGYGWLERLHGDDRERVRENWKAAVRTAVPFDMELRICSSAGEHRWFTARAVPIRDEANAILRWWGTCSDIEDLKRKANPPPRPGGAADGEEPAQAH
ncbi:MAG: PAS domain-containing protein [Burkholderiales bacterium]|nr:PAS domain-containing protein [Burkholderiales bacterium]